MNLIDLAIKYDESEEHDIHGNGHWGHWLVWSNYPGYGRRLGKYPDPDLVLSTPDLDEQIFGALDPAEGGSPELIIMRWNRTGPAKLWLNPLDDGNPNVRVDSFLDKGIGGEHLVPLVELPEDIDEAVALLRTTIQLTDWAALLAEVSRDVG